MLSGLIRIKAKISEFFFPYLDPKYILVFVPLCQRQDRGKTYRKLLCMIHVCIYTNTYIYLYALLLLVYHLCKLLLRAKIAFFLGCHFLTES